MNRTLLVINGDDGGLHPDTDEALLRCAKCRLLRSVSVVANGPTTANFIERAQAVDLGLGLHFNITDGLPVGGPYETLTGADGHFRGKIDTWRMADSLDVVEVAAEARAQWERLEELGAKLDHLDGHNHVQIFGPVLEGLIRALGGENVVLRIPDEPEHPGARPPFPASSLSALDMRHRVAGTSWRTMDRFVGFGFCDNPEIAAIRHLESCAGPTEWMVHPGRRPGSPFTDDERRGQELDLLCSEEMSHLFDTWGYDCGTFAEAP